MDIIDLGQIFEFLRAEPGHGLLQSFLLFMIWLNSRGVKREVMSLGDRLSDLRSSNEFRLDRLEKRLTIVETHSHGGIS